MRTSSGAQLDFTRVVALVAALSLGAIFWDSPVLWPLKLLVVMMHESGHALATLFVGGRVDRVLLSANEAGACLSWVPDGAFPKIAVYSAGYVGSALAGAGMMLATFRFQLRRWVLGAACVWLAVMGVLYAGDLFTIAFCFGTAAVLALGAKFLPNDAVDVLNLFIAAFSALYVVFDLRDDLWRAGTRAVSDAALLAELTWIPAFGWAVLWSLFSLAILAFAAWQSVQRGRRPALAL
ncbi:MAG TPA: M50 family metallopeptidase [Myxococcaceae bacterium]|nr:M50 family metallopeptidase [Myxococcaceae bacterium]